MGSILIAEIKGKISNTGSNLNDRLEDNLTGNVFGTLRYISFEKGLKKILIESISPKNSKAIDIIKNINVEGWDSNISFWPYDKEGELDVLLEFDSCIIGIEVKYLSGISSDDGITNEIILSKNEEKESIQQLARESRIISKKAVNREKILILTERRLAMIRILQCVNDMHRAGLETMLMNYYRNIDRSEIQFDFLTHRPNRSDYDDEIESLGGKVYYAHRLCR